MRLSWPSGISSMSLISFLTNTFMGNGGVMVHESDESLEMFTTKTLGVGEAVACSLSPSGLFVFWMAGIPKVAGCTWLAVIERA